MEKNDLLKRQNQRKKRQQQMMRRRMTVFVILLLLVIVVSVVLALRHNSTSNDAPENVPAQTTQEPVGEEQSTSPTINPEVADSVVFPQEPEKTTDILKGLRMDDGQKIAYLTFDDGPTLTITPQILDILRRYNVKATFFQVGSLMEANADMARRVHSEGHLIANHSYGHNYSKLYATEEAFITEVDHAQEMILKITGAAEYPQIFRFPGGGYDAGTWGANKQKYKEVLEKKGYRFCDWNALNGDAEGGTKTAEQLLERVKKTATKEDVVILMHDAATKKTTVEALPAIIEYLMGQGYAFRRLDVA